MLVITDKPSNGDELLQAFVDEMLELCLKSIYQNVCVTCQPIHILSVWRDMGHTGTVTDVNRVVCTFKKSHFQRLMHRCALMCCLGHWQIRTITRKFHHLFVSLSVNITLLIALVPWSACIVIFYNCMSVCWTDPIALAKFRPNSVNNRLLQSLKFNIQLRL